MRFLKTCVPLSFLVLCSTLAFAGEPQWVEVRSPSGLLERFENLKVDAIQTLKEGSGVPTPAAPSAKSAAASGSGAAAERKN